MLNEKRTLVRNTIWNGLSQSATMLVGFLFMPLLVRAFGLPHYGLFVLVSGIPAYAALLDFGIGPALTRLVAESREHRDNEGLSSAVSTALVFYLLVGVVVAAAMGALGIFAGALFDVTANEAEILRNMLWIGAVLQLIHWPATTARHVLAGLQRYDVMAWGALLSTGLGIATTVFVLLAHEGPVLFMALNGGAAALASLLVVVWARKLVGVKRFVPSRATKQRLSSMLVFGWAVFVLDLSDVLFYQQTDRVLLGVMMGAAAVALYEASAKIASLVTYLGGLTVSAVMPLAASLDAGGQHGSLRALFTRGTKYSAAVIAPVAVAAIVFAEPLFAAWVGADYNTQAGVMKLLVGRHLISATGLMGDMIVISKGRMGPRVPWVLALSVANVMLGVAFVDRWGIGGVALATLITHAIDLPIHVRFLLRETGVSVTQWLREIVLPVYPLLVVPIGVGWALSQTPLTGGLPGLLVCGVVTVAAFWVAFWYVGLSHAERLDVRQVLGTLVFARTNAA